jgi:hypothetical protein
MELVSKQINYVGPVLTESVKAVIHIPTLRISKVMETTLLGNYKATDIDFSTFVRYHNNGIYTLLDIRILGFGFTLTTHRRRTK